jgi:hypothetical protein
MVRTERAHIRVTGLQPAQMLAALVGMVFLVAGVVGFARTGFGDFAGHQHVFLLGFAINPLHNLVHAVIGLLGLLMSVGSGLARTFGWLLFLAYGAVFVWGLMITGALATNPVSGAGNPLNLNTADNWLHFGSAVVGLLIAVLPARKVALVASETAPDASAEPVSAEPVRTADAQSDNVQADKITAAHSERRSGGWRHGWGRHAAG